MCHFLSPVTTSDHTSLMETRNSIFLFYSQLKLLYCLIFTSCLKVYYFQWTLHFNVNMREEGRKWLQIKWCRRQFCRHNLMKLFNYTSPKIIRYDFFFSDCPALCDKAALSHWATKEDESVSSASSERAGSGFEACPLFFPLPACMIRLARAGTRPLSKHFSPPHHLTLPLLLCFFFFFFPTLISTEETSQCRSCPSQTWGSACWECFWGSCWRSPLMDPTPCRAHPGGSKVRLDYTSY